MGYINKTSVLATLFLTLLSICAVLSQCDNPTANAQRIEKIESTMKAMEFRYETRALRQDINSDKDKIFELQERYNNTNTAQPKEVREYIHYLEKRIQENTVEVELLEKSR